MTMLEWAVSIILLLAIGCGLLAMIVGVIQVRKDWRLIGARSGGSLPPFRIPPVPKRYAKNEEARSLVIRPDIWICGGLVVYLMLLIAAFTAAAWDFIMNPMTWFLILVCAPITLLVTIAVIDMIYAASLMIRWWIQARTRGGPDHK